MPCGSFPHARRRGSSYPGARQIPEERMGANFDPKNRYAIFPDLSGTGGRVVRADSFEVTPGGALIFTSVGDDGVRYVTHVVAPHAYAHMVPVDDSGAGAAG